MRSVKSLVKQPGRNSWLLEGVTFSLSSGHEEARSETTLLQTNSSKVTRSRRSKRWAFVKVRGGDDGVPDPFQAEVSSNARDPVLPSEVRWDWGGCQEGPSASFPVPVSPNVNM